MSDGPQTQAAPAGERGSLLARARAHDTAAIQTMFRQFLPADEPIVDADYLGTAGVWGLGTHTFFCVTESRLATLRVKLLGGVQYEDASLERVSSGVVRQPSRIFLYLFVALAILLTLGIALLLLPFVVRAFHRFVKSGLVFWSVDGVPIHVYCDRRLLPRANALYRAAASGIPIAARSSGAAHAETGGAAEGAAASRQSLLARARGHDPAALATIFRQFLPPGDRIVAVESLGTQGVWGFGVHSFGCATDARVATLRVKLLGGFEYQDAVLPRVTGGMVRQPSRVFLYLFVAVATLFTLGVALLLLPLTVRAYYRFVKSGVVFWTSAHRPRLLRGVVFWTAEGLPVYLFSDRKLLLRATALYRAALGSRAALTQRAAVPAAAAAARVESVGGRVQWPAVVAAAAALLLVAGSLGAIVILRGDDDSTAPAFAGDLEVGDIEVEVVDEEPVTETEPVEPAGFPESDAELALYDVIPSAVTDFAACERDDTEGAEAGAVCEAAGDLLLQYYSFSDATAMEAAYDGRWAADGAQVAIDGDCPDDPLGEEEWVTVGPDGEFSTGDDVTGGLHFCYTTEYEGQRDAHLAWTSNEHLVLAIVSHTGVSDDVEPLVAYWAENANGFGT